MQMVFAGVLAAHRNGSSWHLCSVDGLAPVRQKLGVQLPWLRGIRDAKLTRTGGRIPYRGKAASGLGSLVFDKIHRCSLDQVQEVSNHRGRVPAAMRGVKSPWADWCPRVGVRDPVQIHSRK